MISSSLLADPPQGYSGISKLQAADAPACSLFMQQLDPRDIKMRFGVLHPSIKFFLPDERATNKRATFAASNATGAIVGILTLGLLSATSVESGIIVRSDLKGRGIGRALLAHALEWAKSNGFSHVVGFIDHENRRMRTLAQAAGFRAVAQDQFYLEMRASIVSRQNCNCEPNAVEISAA